MKNIPWAWLGAGAGAVLVGTAFLAGRSWGPGAQWAAAAYAVLVSLFLAAQVVGFVLSQVKYVDSVEQAKFKVLEAEGLLAEIPHEA